jgi:MFS family permease
MAGMWNDEQGGGMYKANVLHLGFAFFLVYTAFSGIQNLSASLIHPKSLGTATIGTLYVIFAASCLVGPAFVARVGNSKSLAFGFCCMCFFCVAYVVASNDNDLQVVNWPVLMLAGAAVGFAASPIWVAQGAYITQQAKLWSAASPPLDAAGNAIVGAADAIPRMGDANGIFWACFQATQISGNILPSVMLNAGASNTAVFLVYLVFAICGTLVASRLRKPPAEAAELVTEAPQELTPVMESVTSMVGAWSNPRMYSLIPIIMFSGLEMGFIWGDFTANYVKPTLGKADIGYVMCIFGVSDIFFSFLFGKLSDMPSIGRMPILALGGVAQLVIMIVSLGLEIPDCAALGPDPTGKDYDGGCLSAYNAIAKVSSTKDYGTESSWWLKLIAMAFVWSIGDAAWNTQLNSIISETFTDDPAPGFANLKLWQSLMTGAAFFYAIVTTGTDRLYVMLAVLGLGGLGLLNLRYNVANKSPTLHEPLISA